MNTIFRAIDAILTSLFPPMYEPTPMAECDLPITAVSERKDDGEFYLYVFDDDHALAAMVRITHDAANPDLSLTWADAARLNRRVRESVGARGIR